MTTKTTRKQAESVPEPPTPSTANGVEPASDQPTTVSTIVDDPPAEDVGELSAEEKALIAALRSPEHDSMTHALGALNTAYAQHHAETAAAVAQSVDDLAHTLEQLTPENRILFGAMVDAAHRVESAKEWAEWEKRREVERQRNLKRAREMRTGIELDDVERLSLSLIGNLAMNYDITRESLYENGLESLFRCIDKTLRAGLAQADFDDLEVIVEAARAGTSTAPKMSGYGDDEEDEPVDDDDESDGDELPLSA